MQLNKHNKSSSSSSSKVRGSNFQLKRLKNHRPRNMGWATHQLPGMPMQVLSSRSHQLSPILQRSSVGMNMAMSRAKYLCSCMKVHKMQLNKPLSQPWSMMSPQQLLSNTQPSNNSNNMQPLLCTSQSKPRNKSILQWPKSSQSVRGMNAVLLYACALNMDYHIVIESDYTSVGSGEGGVM